jgi:hypothetical protein
MSHPLVVQLRFARSEFQRGLAGLTDADARRRLTPMNAISWMIGHLAWQEQRYWLQRAQGHILLPGLNELFAYGAPPAIPGLGEAWGAWSTITERSDPWLDELDEVRVTAPITEGYSSVGTFLLRTTYHYWYHLGEALAVRQMLGHTGLPDFVGDIDGQAPYGLE